MTAKRKTKKKAEPTPEARPERKIAIFGTTPSRMSGPTGDDSGWERWTIGPGGKDAHNWERLFEVHMTWPDNFAEYLDDLRKVEPPAEIWSLVPLAGAKSNKVINRDLLYDKYGRMWFSSSISYALAIAIEEGATDLGCWGIDLESGEEYISQFAGCKFFLTLARLAGINVHLPPDCGLLRDITPYPDRYENHIALTLERKFNFLNQALANMEPQFDSKKAEVHRCEGELLTLRRLGIEAKEIGQCEQRLLASNIQLGQIGCNVNQLKGELNATQFYRRMYVWGMVDPV